MALADAIPPGRPRRVLAGVLAAGLVLQVALVADGLATNPLARNPLNDAAEYWSWGGAIARGELVGHEPFLSGPLYPYVVGLVRALGGGLAALAVLQVALHVLTAWLVARCAGARFGAAAGIVGAGLYLVLRDPAFHTGRVLNCTVQALATAWIWERALAAGERFDARRAALLGLAIGAGSLANPTYAPLAALLPAWLVWKHGARAAVLRRALGVALAAAITIAPATLHNWLAAREFVPLSAQAGLGFYHGNQPGSEGIFTAAEGVSTDRTRQNLDAREAVRDETGGSWSRTSAVYLRRGLAHWNADPAAALQLAALKVWWFFGGRAYGDVYVAELEARDEDGLGRALALAPMPLAWWTVPSLLVVLALARRPREHAPEILLWLATFLVVAVFWYSPRYRLPIAPLVAGFGGAALVALARHEASRARAAAVAVSIAASVAVAALLCASGRDDPQRFRAQFEMQVGDAYMAESEWAAAAARYERAESLGARAAGGRRADALRRMGRGAEALDALQRAVLADPANAVARRGLAIALVQSGDLDGARRAYESALERDARDAEAWSGLGSVKLAQGDAAGAAEAHERALAITPRYANAHANLGRAREALGDVPGAEAAYRAALALEPESRNALAGLGDLLVARREWPEGLAHLRALARLDPSNRAAARNLAWWLATVPDAEARDPRAALALVSPDIAAQDVDAQNLGAQDLDTLAAVLAANGRYAEARQAIERALESLRRDGPREPIPELEARAALYAAGRPYVLPP